MKKKIISVNDTQAKKAGLPAGICSPARDITNEVPFAPLLEALRSDERQRTRRRFKNKSIRDYVKAAHGAQYPLDEERQSPLIPW